MNPRLSAEDRLDIQQLVHRYNRAIDTGQVDDWVSTFTDDGEFHGIAGTFVGSDELTQFARDYWTKPQYERFRNSQHWVGNMIFEVVGDHVVSTCDHLLVKQVASSLEIVVMATYRDELQRTPAGWKFRRRFVERWRVAASAPSG